MKKLISLVLALVLVLSLSTVAFAAEGSVTEGVQPTLTLTKEYDTNVTGVYPTEDLTFTVAKTQGDGDCITLNGTAGTTAGSYVYEDATDGTQIVVGFPKYTSVGEWRYTITESDAGNQAVTYGPNTEIEVVVTVAYKVVGDVVDYNTLVATVTTYGASKNDTDFNNSYELGSLQVKKNVEGNLTNESHKFEMTVEFTAQKPVVSPVMVNGKALEWTGNKATATIMVSEDSPVTIENIPTDITYTVVEDSKYADADDAAMANPDKGYTVTYDAGCAGTISTTQSVATVKNVKNIATPTGVELDSVPYIVLMVAAVLGMGIMLTKKRAY